MTEARWQMIKAAYFEACSRPESEQERFLTELATVDSDVSGYVRGLLSETGLGGLDLRRSCWAADQAPGGQLLEQGCCLKNRFEITNCLGSGGTGEVYRAFDREQRDFVAVKVLRPEAVPDRQAQVLLRNELHTARMVTHINVCRLHEFYPAEAGEHPFITMELVAGRTMQARLAEEGPYTEAEAVPVVGQMFDGLEAAHAQKVLHRDFKPGNIMLSEGSRVVLMDFGLARDMRPGPDIATTITTNKFAGTLAYMAPEQLQGEAATTASDIHALGVVLFEMLTGGRPFDGASPMETACRRLHEEAPRPRAGGKPLKRCWECAILQCLARDPKDRPASVASVRRILAEGAPFLWGRRRLIIGFGAAAVICLGGVAVQTGRGPLAPQVSAAAFDHYLRGSKLLEEFTVASAGAALTHFASAMATDPGFALAMSAAADAHLFLKNAGRAEARQHLEEARRLAEMAVNTDPALAEAHTSLAAVRQAEWNWKDAERNYKEALRLKPGLAKTHRWYGGMILQFGRFEEALAHARKAMELDPHDRALPATIGLYFFLAGKYQEALGLLEPAVQELDSVGRSGNSRFNLAQVYARLGYLTRGEESREYFGKALRQAGIIKAIESQKPGGGPSLANPVFALIHSLRGDNEAAEPYFESVRAAYDAGREPALHVAWVYASQRRNDEAITVLARGVDEHDPTMLYIKVMPFFENLRNDRRFQELIQRLAL